MSNLILYVPCLVVHYCLLSLTWLVHRSTTDVKTAPKITREILMEYAIEEIMKLREERSQVNQSPTEADSPFQLLRTGRFPKYTGPIQQSLSDPYNRVPYSIQVSSCSYVVLMIFLQDLERAFQTMFAREVEQFVTIDSKRYPI